VNPLNSSIPYFADGWQDSHDTVEVVLNSEGTDLEMEPAQHDQGNHSIVVFHEVVNR